MRATGRQYWGRAILVSVIAFALGVAMYILVGIALAHGVTNANAAWNQITVAATADCDCIVKFAPDPPMVGSGRVTDSYVTYNSNISLLIGVSGVGEVVIADQNGNVLFVYSKTTGGYEEIVANITLPDGLGLYELTISIDGVEAVGSNVVSPMFISYIELPVGPPNTGLSGGHLYVGGYAAQTLGVLFSGLLFGAVAFGLFILMAAKRRKQEAERARGDLMFGKTMKRQLSPKAIDQAGRIAKRSRAKRGGKKSR